MATSPSNTSDQLRSARRRVRFSTAIILVLLLIVTARLFQIQILEGANMAQAAQNLRLREETIQPLRGSIVDQDGEVLAQSVERYDLVISQEAFAQVTGDDKTFRREDPNTGKEIDISVDQGIKELAGVLGFKEEDVRKAVIGTKQYSMIAKTVTPDIKNKALALRLPGLVANQVDVRTYPNGPVAGQVLGYVFSDGKAGLEGSQDEKLTGTPGKRTYEIGGDGILIPFSSKEDTPAVNGSTVKLTLDKDIQFAAQQYVASANTALSGDWTCAVVMKKNAEIVALADSTFMDPNDPAKTETDFRQSMCTTAAIEPGSTTKLITIAAAMEEGKIGPLSTFNTPNRFTIGGQEFKDYAEHPTINSTVAGIFADSLNTGTVQIGDLLTKKQRYDWLTKFGANKMLDIGLQGSTPGYLAKPEEWDDRQQYTVLFGQGISQTVLHTAMQYQAIANDGVIKTPQLVDSYIAPDGTETKAERDPGTRILSEDTVKKMDGLLETGTKDGYGRAGALDQWRVGSKTGTAEAPSPNGGYEGTTITYAGIAPMDDPQYIVVVTTQRPKVPMNQSSTGPAFKDIMKQVLIQNKVAPSTGEPTIYPKTAE